MKKQTILITGASSGIEVEIARYFLKEGDNVVLNLPTAEKSIQAFRELGGGENLAMAVGTAIDRITGIKLLATAVAKFGSIDVLINSASDLSSRPFFHIDEAYFDRFIDANLKGAFFITQGIIPQMLKQGNGTVINIDTSLISHSRRTDESSKIFLPRGIIHSLTLQLAAEFADSNIKFHTITPEQNGDRNTGQVLSKGFNKFEIIAQMAYDAAKGNFNGPF